MTHLLNAVSFSALLTAIYAFRYVAWRRPKRLAIYFTGFATLEVVMAEWVLPEGALGLELSAVCLPLALVFGAASWVADRQGAAREGPRSAAGSTTVSTTETRSGTPAGEI